MNATDPEATTTPDVVVHAVNVKTEVEYRVTFTGPQADANAAAWVEARRYTHMTWLEDDFDSEAAPLTADAIHPRCEHGLSEALCGGPMHWYDR